MIEKITAIFKSGAIVELNNVTSIKSNDRVVNKYVTGSRFVKHEVLNDGHIIELLPISKTTEELKSEIMVASSIGFIINTIKFENSGDVVIYKFKVNHIKLYNDPIKRKDLGERIYYNQPIIQLYCKMVGNN